jgi:hypothetical protein
MFVDVGCPLWREDWSVVYNCCWSSPAQSFLGLSPAVLMTTFYCLRFETPPTCRARSPYLYPPGTRCPSYTPRHWVPFSSPPTTRRAMVEVFETASTRAGYCLAMPRILLKPWKFVYQPLTNNRCLFCFRYSDFQPSCHNIFRASLLGSGFEKHRSRLLTLLTYICTCAITHNTNSCLRKYFTTQSIKPSTIPFCLVSISWVTTYSNQFQTCEVNDELIRTELTKLLF